MLSGWGVGVSRRRRLHPCHAANAGVGSAHEFDKLPRGRVVGGRCAKGTHFRGYGFIAANGLAQSVVSTPMQPVGRRLVSSPTPPTGYLTIFKCSCRALYVP